MAPKGNKYSQGHKNARKLKTEDQMQKVYKHYCDHLAAGKVKKSWYYDDGELTLTHDSIENYIANEPSNFPPEKKAAAIAKGMQYWESVVDSKAFGTNKDADTATLQMLMRNKYGWDKEESQGKESTEPLIKALARKWRGN